MIHRFSMKCEVCKQWKHEYNCVQGKIICDSCFQKSEGKVRLPLKEPHQISIDEILGIEDGKF